MLWCQFAFPRLDIKLMWSDCLSICMCLSGCSIVGLLTCLKFSVFVWLFLCMFDFFVVAEGGTHKQTDRQTINTTRQTNLETNRQIDKPYRLTNRQTSNNIHADIPTKKPEPQSSKTRTKPTNNIVKQPACCTKMLPNTNKNKQ